MLKPSRFRRNEPHPAWGSCGQRAGKQKPQNQTTQPRVLVTVTRPSVPSDWNQMVQEEALGFGLLRLRKSLREPRSRSEAPWAGPGQLPRHSQVSWIETCSQLGAKAQGSPKHRPQNKTPHRTGGCWFSSSPSFSSLQTCSEERKSWEGKMAVSSRWV